MLSQQNPVIATNPGVVQQGQMLHSLLSEAVRSYVATAHGADSDLPSQRPAAVRLVGMPINSVTGRVRSLLDKGALVIRGELRCANTGKYRELLGLPEKQQ